MKRRSFLKKSATVGASTIAAGAVAACSPSPVDPKSGTVQGAAGATQTQPTLELKMVTTWGKNFPGLGTRAVEFAEDIEKATNGRIKIRVYAAEELVPALQAFDAVSQGNADIYHGPDY
ncbi:MAG: ABC transporter substrate-binding protein, partial [Kordiimonadaceae bacterium]|nr:ABC transporter substrate-binding protein [Kordiimonadaceae bacterium]